MKAGMNKQLMELQNEPLIVRSRQYLTVAEPSRCAGGFRETHRSAPELAEEGRRGKAGGRASAHRGVNRERPEARQPQCGALERGTCDQSRRATTT